GLAAVQAERIAALALHELQRDDAHHDQIAAVDALEALGDDRLDAKQRRALGRPVARATGAVLVAGQDDQRRAVGLVTVRGLEDRHLLVRREVARPPALAA